MRSEAAAVSSGVSLDFDWVRVPAGACTLGAGACAPTDVNPDELPGGSLVLPAYLIARTPVTNQQYAAFVAASGHRPPGHWEDLRPPPALARHPVTYVDWHDARAFCAWAGVRLPSEAEWEKAARGEDGRLFPWGAAPPGPLQANCAGRLATTTPVGSCPAGASPYGALDMAGNVWEWTASSYRAYPYHPDDGREDPAAPGRRVLRGGSYNHGPADVRCAARGQLYADASDEYIGFRVAADGTNERSRPAFDWITIPAGPFLIGGTAARMATASPASAPAQPGLGWPSHTVALPAYLIARTPVTNQHYAAFVTASGHRPPGHWEGPRPPLELERHPVTYVDWYEAGAFCAWAGVRLPSEAEWEKAARGEDGRDFPWGAAPPSPTLARFGSLSHAIGTLPVGSCPAGASPYGALDMAGNVWEWTASLIQPYPYRPDDGREDRAQPGRRVLRGGSFRSADDRYLRCAFRSMSYPTRRRDHIGFRVACTAAHEYQYHPNTDDRVELELTQGKRIK